MSVATSSSRPPGARVALDYAGLLNEEQQAVVEAGTGRLLVIAGAGSGKTRTLTCRVARLLQRGLPPDGLLLLTFTNKAAREMLRRVEEVAAARGRGASGAAPSTTSRTAAAPARAGSLGYRGLHDARPRGREGPDGAGIAERGLAVGTRRFPKADVLVDLVSMAVNPQTPLAEVWRTAGRSSSRSRTRSCGWRAASPSASARMQR